MKKIKKYLTMGSAAIMLASTPSAYSWDKKNKEIMAQTAAKIDALLAEGSVCTNFDKSTQIKKSEGVVTFSHTDDEGKTATLSVSQNGEQNGSITIQRNTFTPRAFTSDYLEQTVLQNFLARTTLILQVSEIADLKDPKVWNC